ncbi:hypothetical protein MLD38_035205 [Melastoma candidum]|uniref:Uncharacterized protein n=1 Tax=Melastoma candidum TaxID=119954 RepID=A0ACB9MEB6_9MYRT|nr:hypothetical protein MLD38_035205 [Melastoma candidum]
MLGVSFLNLDVVLATDDEKIAECCRGFGDESCSEAVQNLKKKCDIAVQSGKVNPQFPYMLHQVIQSYNCKFLKLYPELSRHPLNSKRISSS